MSDSKTDLENLPQVYPFRVQNSLNGLATFSCGPVGSSRRIQTASGSLDTTSLTPPTNPALTGSRFVTMVFGSQNGGGKALVGLADGALTRAKYTKDDPIAPIAIDTWVDGVKVDPTTTGLSGGWQIISLDVTGHNVNAFGWALNHTTCGGQNYGEILVFAETLADAERVNVETYLAEKWGLTGQYQGVTALTEHPATAFVYGDSGNVEIEGHIQLSGTYSGTIAVEASSTLTVTPKYAPEIPTAGRVGWFDPDAADALRTGTENGTATYTTPIWKSASNTVTTGTTRLNGKAVNGTTTEYTGEAEVLSLVATETVKLGILGFFGNTERSTGYGERIGEILMYSTALTATQVKTIEDYLMFKWIGIAPDGYGDFTEATLSGVGDVEATAW